MNEMEDQQMAYVVTKNCFGCKYTDCVVVCPTMAFREVEQMLYIDPDECVDCDACVPECPVEAIFYEENVPSEQREFIALNAEMSKVCPPIVEKRAPLAR
jgi:ferredoxin